MNESNRLQLGAELLAAFAAHTATTKAALAVTQAATEAANLGASEVVLTANNRAAKACRVALDANNAVIAARQRLFPSP